MKPRFLVVCLSLALGAGSLVAHEARAAEASAEEQERAKMLFSSGAQAYAAGQFSAAIQAFTEANRILPRPAIVYSLAQAHRRQYFIARKPESLRAAVANFRAYIEQVPDGGRRADAAQALSELEPMLVHLAPEPLPAGPKEAQEPPKEPPRLMITTQPSGASFTIDGRDRRQAPYAAEVTPGKHRVRVTLDGYFDEEREVLAVDRTLVPVPVELRPRPAHLVIHAPSGCDVWLDGRVVGTAPLLGAIELSSGEHLISVTKNGYKAYSQEIDFRHDERRTLDVHLEATGQRIVARSLLISGGALVVAGGVFSFLALNREQAAQDVSEAQTRRPATPSDQTDYQDARDARDRWRTGAILAFSVGGAALATGLVFYAFDRPTVIAPRGRPEQERRPRPANPLEPVEMSLAPFVGPSFGGATISGKF
ncbi:PEGA domain-containing protein [Pendulispora brunnea]|uniref:PEGA domain-containing protein n=1 Tax=Pendulispora brunnea TaxID=2905690 RepID=A0ABZ2KJC6_9BACT